MKKIISLITISLFLSFNVKAKTVTLMVKDVLDLGTYEELFDVFTEDVMQGSQDQYVFIYGDNGEKWFGNPAGEFQLEWKLGCHSATENYNVVTYQKNLYHQGELVEVISKGHQSVKDGEVVTWSDHSWQGSKLVVRQVQEVTCSN